MSRRDWNHNGKRDIFDRGVDFQLAKYWYEKHRKDTSKNTSESKFEDDYEDEEMYTSTSSVRNNNQWISSQEDLFGMKEISGKSTEAIWSVVLRRKNKMESCFERLSLESGFRDAMDNRQMQRDFFLHNFEEMVDFTVLEDSQKVRALQLLLDTFCPDNPMTAEKHYKSMEENDAYFKYIIHCFGIICEDAAVFFRILGWMAAKSKELGGMALEYMKDYIKIMVQVEAYLNGMFPEAYSAGCMKIYIERVLNYVGKALEEESDAMWNTDYLVNPIYTCF